MRDHDPIIIRDFLGIFDREDDDSVPPGFFKDSRNIRFLTGGIKSREGTTLDISIASVKRMAVYRRIGEAQRLLLLNGAGQLFDSTNLVTPVLTIAAMSDFSVEVMFNRAYITPHNGITGLPGEKVYVYDGAGVARPAAGLPPSIGNITVGDSLDSGNCEVGTKVFAVCYETTSGYLTKPAGFKAFSPAGGKSLIASTLPIGPSWVAARVLVSTKSILNFNGDFTNQEYFIVPGGRVGNNVSTSVEVSFFDADLQESADYLMDQLPEIPAGVGLRNYRGRLCVWGEDANPSIVRVSVAGQPESFDAVEGFVTVNPGDSGGGVLNCVVYRKQLLCMKQERTYVTLDTGDNGAFWDVDDVDPSIGTSCHGIARIREFGDTTEDRLFVASKQGLQLFNGTYSDAVVTFDIDNLWARITQAYFHTIECVVDPLQFLVFCAVPLDGATSPNAILVGDYQEGMDKFKWTVWSFPNNATTIVVDVNFADKVSALKFGSVTGNVYKLNTGATDDFGNAIVSYVRFGHLPVDDDGKVWHFTGIRVRARGNGNLDPAVYGLDDVQTLTPPSVVLSASPGRELFRGFNFVNERCSVKLGIDSIGEWFRITKFVLYGTIEWETRPE
jgi:hypothetical protein